MNFSTFSGKLSPNAADPNVFAQFFFISGTAIDSVVCDLNDS